MTPKLTKAQETLLTYMYYGTGTKLTGRPSKPELSLVAKGLASSHEIKIGRWLKITAEGRKVCEGLKK